MISLGYFSSFVSSVSHSGLRSQLVRALRYVNFNNTSSFSVETYSHSPSIDIPEQFEMIPRADFEKNRFFLF